MTVRWWIATPAGRAGAIATIALHADEPKSLEAALEDMDVPGVSVGSLRVRVVAGIDQCVIARWSPVRAEVMPHGGVAVMRALAAELADRFGAAHDPDPLDAYPESSSELEARMLASLAHAASPQATDVLLAQPQRWTNEHAGQTEHAGQLARLINPPLVVAVGPANVGKSSLLNALAGRPAALVADVPGTTRDHVGAMLDVDGLVVRYVDTPGRGVVDVSDADRAALEAADQLLANADLVLSCFDATASPIDAGGPTPALRVRTRADLGGNAPPADVSTSAQTGDGIDALARLIRRALVSDEALDDPRPWAFWEGPSGFRVGSGRGRPRA
ncbi:MAG: GTPase [Phycisphaerales bacterium]